MQFYGRPHGGRVAWNLNVDTPTAEKIAALVSEPIWIAEYDPAWPGLFDAEVELLRGVLPRECGTRFEHFGSTAVPGLAAKPILDILAAVPSDDVAHTGIAPCLEPLGYECFWRTDVATPYAWCIKRGPDGQRTHHVHFATPDSPLWDRLYFRDFLREFASARTAYERLKRALSTAMGTDRVQYSAGKRQFIDETTAAAKAYYSAV